MRYAIISGIILLTFLVGVSMKPPYHLQNIPDRTIALFRSGSVDFQNTTAALSNIILQIDSTKPLTILNAINALKKSRYDYKKISFFLDYFFPASAWIFNAPAKYELEEPFMEYEEPHGLQQLESLLFNQHPARHKAELEEQAIVISESARGLQALVYQFSPSDGQVLESIRIELIRIMCLYIAGYDAPCLKTGISESLEALKAFQYVLSVYFIQSGSAGSRLSESLQRAIHYLKANRGFDSFDRLTFLSIYAIPLEHQLSSFIQKKGLKICSVTNLDYSAPDLLHGEVHMAGMDAYNSMIKLGKKLFSERELSGNDSRSCITCHQPQKYYSDHLTKNLALDQQSRLKRNTPTLLYAAFQSAQFWDGRAKSQIDQILDVLKSPQEMNGQIPVIERKLNQNLKYRTLFKEAFPSEDSITIDQVSVAISNFLRSLAPMNSAFDRFFLGEKKALSPDQKKGFNLFMGKAQCGTCHFIPFFNGSTPPFFNRSEYEVLGVPETDNFKKVIPDKDEGRFSYFPSPFYHAAFKTPTLRNIAMTGPYMHNGSFKSLTKVLEFYNRGGGAGLGLKIPNQTLSDKPLHLTKQEIREITLFLKSLTDSLGPT